MTLLFISTGEVVILLFAVLMLFGPDRLPGFVRSLAKGIRTVKNAQADLTQQMTQMAKDEPSLREVSDVVKDVKDEIDGVVPRKK
ncbi:MAG: Sec-independent protein translocase subunit TatA/TatB [Schleiferiaceae bacterium]